MNKSVLFGIGGIVSVGALVLLMLDDDVALPSTSSVPSQQERVQKERSDTSDVTISYEAKERATIAAKQETQTKRKPREKYLESKTYDRSKRFEIALINKNLEQPRKPGGYSTLQGTIDGESFSLKVPKELIKEGSGITELRVTDLKTNGVSTVSAAFIDDMRNPMVRQRVEINSKDLENFVQTEVEAISPPRPGEAIR